MATGLNIAINIQGDKSFMRKLENLGKTWFEWKAAFEETGVNLKGYFAGQAYDSMGGVFGTPWAQLSPSTIAQKSKHYATYASVPLMRTTTMRESFEHKASATHLEITNSAPYFVYHQSSEPRHKIPRRPMFGINHDVKEIIRLAFDKVALVKIREL